eukprot:2336664-Heterocapsa_arctica.AAC.1
MGRGTASSSGANPVKDYRTLEDLWVMSWPDPPDGTSHSDRVTPGMTVGHLRAMLAIRVGTSVDQVFLHLQNTPQRLDDRTQIATMPRRVIIFYLSTEDAASAPMGAAPFLTPEGEDANDNPAGDCDSAAASSGHTQPPPPHNPQAGTPPSQSPQDPMSA